MNLFGAMDTSGEAMQAMEGFVTKLPQGIGFDWNGLRHQRHCFSHFWRNSRDQHPG